MKKYFVALGVFVVGMLAVLLSTVLYPALKNATSNLSADTASMASHYWGWSWVSTPAVVIMLVFVLSILGISYVAVKKFLSQR